MDEGASNTGHEAVVRPKAALKAAKHRAIIAAARDCFLRHGYSEASMDGIAEAAGVSIKTVYNHFKNKAELFGAMMTFTCEDPILSRPLRSHEALAAKFPWFNDPSVRGLTEAGKQYLHHLLSEEQVALYRLVTRDADRFPELGRLYQQQFARGRTEILVAYLARTARVNRWKRTDAEQTASIYESLLRAEIFEAILHGSKAVEGKTVDEHARRSARILWKMLVG